MTEQIRTGGQDDDTEVGRRVHMRMWDLHITQTALAKQIGLQQSAVGKKLRGRNGWGVGDLKRTARALGTTVAYLVGETDDPRRPGRPDDDGELPRLDSNQQPFDCRSTARVTRLADWRTRTRNRTDRAS